MKRTALLTLWLAAVYILAGCAMAGAAQSEDGVFRATISPVTEAQHGQWNVALAEFSDGRVLAIWEAGHTEVKTPNVIMSSLSGDGGRTWGERREFYRRPGIRCTPCGFYRVKTLLHCVHAELPMAGGKEPCRVLDRTSSDGGASWSEAREIWRREFGVAMQPVVLRDGRIVLPVYHRGTNSSGMVTSISSVLVSKDDGVTWQEGANIPADLPGGAMEPALAETSESDWLCVIRTRGTGWLYASRSKDSGRTWATPAPLPLESPESIARLQRLGDGSLLVVWNGVASKTQGPRNRLTVARSVDGGRTWPQRRDLVQGGPVFSNHGVMQMSDGRIIVGYQHFYRDPVRAPERGGVDSVDLAGFDLNWLAVPAPEPQVTVAPVVTVRERPGITGAGWAVAYDVVDGAKSAKRITHIYPNHPDDWGKSGGTGLSCSDDGGQTWKAGPDNSPFPGMVDMWQDRLCNGDLMTLGIRSVPNREKVLTAPATATSEYLVAISKDQGKTWQAETARLHCPSNFGVIARPLPRIFEDESGALFMPAFSWSKAGNRALLLKSGDRGRNWNISSTIATAQAMRTCGAALASPWVETAVARTSDGSLLAVVRTGSSAQSALVMARSTDGGVTWSPVEKLLAGPRKRIAAGKLPGLCLLPNGVLVLLTAHTKNHCRIYLSHDGTGREWNDGFIITSQSGGNTSMIAIGPDKLLVFTPANGRIQCWQVTITKRDSAANSALSAPSNITVSGTNVRVSWKAPAAAASVAHYLVTHVLIKPSADNKDTEIYPYAPIWTRDAATQLELGRVLSIGGTYRIEVAAVDRDGHVSPAATSGEVAVGTSSIPK